MVLFTQISNKIHRLNYALSFRRSYCCPTTQKMRGLVLGVYSNEETKELQLTPAAEKYNNSANGKLLDQIKLAGNKVKPGSSLVFWGLDPKYNAVALVGLGSKTPEPNEIELLCQEKEAVRIAAAAGCKSLDSVGIKSIDVDALCDAESAAEGSELSIWKFQEYKTKKDEKPVVQPYDPTEAECAKWNRGAIKANAQNLARKLADTPANLLTPTIFAEEAKKLLAPLQVSINVYEKKWAQDQKMNAFLCVAQGSIEPPKFLEITYNRIGDKTSPIVLVGKGVTFDAGGISIKPSLNMDQMRADMGGAASLIGTLVGLAQLDVKAHVKVLIPLVENLPSGTAVKPGDVITAKNGKTICVDNTDAEGRLVLADALCYSAQFDAKWILDIATLTGAMAVALGNAATGVFSNCNELYGDLEQAGSRTGDRVWRFPLWKHYTKQIAENPGYDLNNIGKGKGGGSCTAAAFLREFVPEKKKWMHLDMASVMGPDDSAPYLSKGMTGRPTRTLIEFVESQSKKQR